MSEIVQNARVRVKGFRAQCTSDAVTQCAILDGETAICEMIETPADRLRQLLIRDFPGARNAQTAAARRYGFNPNTFGSHVRGARDVTAKKAREYGAAFGVDPEWILYGVRHKNVTTDGGIKSKIQKVSRPPVDSVRIPRLNWGMINGSTGILEATTKAQDHVDIPSGLKLGPRAFSLDVLDESMIDPAAPYAGFKPGDKLIFDPDMTAKPGEFVLAWVEGEELEVFRQLRKAPKDDAGRNRVTLVPLNPHDEAYHVTLGVNGRIIARLAYRIQTF
jgi:SOS-response transcriptional repressor LexA